MNLNLDLNNGSVGSDHEGEGNSPRTRTFSQQTTRTAPTNSTSTTTTHVAQPCERILSTPRKFQPGEDPLVWIEDFNLTAKGNNWHAATKLNTVGLYLSGTAQKWYITNHNSWSTFNAFTEAFENRYLTHALKAKARMAAQEYRQSQYQTVDEVITDLNQLFRTAKITDDELKRYYLLAALRPEIRHEVLRNRMLS